MADFVTHDVGHGIPLLRRFAALTLLPYTVAVAVVWRLDVWLLGRRRSRKGGWIL